MVAHFHRSALARPKKSARGSISTTGAEGYGNVTMATKRSFRRGRVGNLESYGHGEECQGSEAVGVRIATQSNLICVGSDRPKRCGILSGPESLSEIWLHAKLNDVCISLPYPIAL